MQKHLISKNHLENEMIIPEVLMKEEQKPNTHETKKVYNPKTLKQIARDITKTKDKELDKQLAKRLISPVFLMIET